MFNLRQYQADDFARINNSLENHHRVVYVLPTGGGKTTIIAQKVQTFPGNVLIDAHRRELVDQISSRLGVEHGIISPHHRPQYYHRVQVGMVQSIVGRLSNPFFPRPGLIITDEAHHAVSPSYAKIMQAFPEAQVLGVTATPERLDGKGLGQYFDDMVVGPSTADLTAMGYLVPARIFSGRQVIDTAGIKTQMGDFAKGAVADAADKPRITGDAVEHYARLGKGMPFLANCVNVAHSEHVAEQFRAAGYRVVSVDGTTEDRVRRNAVRDLATGALDGICNCDLFGEGVDIPVLFCMISLRPTQSLALWLQQCGRVLRPADGKDYALILDHAGNYERHGLPDEPREWSLGGRAKSKGKKEENKIRVRLCPDCFGVHMPAPVCPYCGHAYKVEPRVIEQVEGVLVEVTGRARRAAEFVLSARERKIIEMGGPIPAPPRRNTEAAA